MAIGRWSYSAALALALALIGLPSGPRAQPADFPNRPVRLIVPFAPGGGVDIVARLVAPKLSEAWRQPVVVENKAGAVGALASEYVAHQAADDALERSVDDFHHHAFVDQRARIELKLARDEHANAVQFDFRNSCRLAFE